MKYFLVLVLSIIMVSCLSDNGSNVNVKSEDDTDYNVKLLFEVDGVKVYRFRDGRNVYFTNTNSKIGYQYSTNNGKAKSRHELETICNSNEPILDSILLDDGRLVFIQYKIK